MDNDSYSDYSEYDDCSSQSEDEDFLVECPHCPSPVKKSNYEDHINRVHRCDACGKCMPKKALLGHKKRCHMQICLTCGKQMLKEPMEQHLKSHQRECQHCKKMFLEGNLDQHIRDSHALSATIGMIRLDKIAEFNRLVAQTRIYCDTNGHVFIKSV